jgi:hypothetical protein
MNDHWLARPTTIRLLWRSFIGLLVIVALADLAIDLHGYFWLDGTLGFYSWFGFLSCLALVASAKTLGVPLKRRDDYYRD